VIAISISDPMAHLLNDVDDVELHLPGAIKAIREYFRDYKSFSGKINKYALRAQAMPRHYALKVLEETHQHWKSLHLVKKRDIIGESSAQAGMRVVEQAAAQQMSAIQLAAGSASPRLQAAGSASPRLQAGNASPRVVGMGASTAMPLHGQMQQAAVQPPPTTSPMHKGKVQPIAQLTGMDQPLDSLYRQASK